MEHPDRVIEHSCCHMPKDGPHEPFCPCAEVDRSMPNHVPMRDKIEMIRDAAQDAADGSLVSVRKELLQRILKERELAELLLIDAKRHLIGNSVNHRTLREAIDRLLGAEE